MPHEIPSDAHEVELSAFCSIFVPNCYASNITIRNKWLTNDLTLVVRSSAAILPKIVNYLTKMGQSRPDGCVRKPFGTGFHNLYFSSTGNSTTTAQLDHLRRPLPLSLPVNPGRTAISPSQAPSTTQLQSVQSGCPACCWHFWIFQQCLQNLLL